MTQVLLGLVAFGVLLALWVIIPHRVVHRRRAGEGAASGAAAAGATRAIATAPMRRRRRPEIPRVVDMRLQRCARTGAAGPAYELVVDLAGVGAPTTGRIPVYRDLVRSERVLLKERYRTEIAGLPLVAGNLAALERAAREVLVWVLEGYRLPRFVFRVRGGPAVPVTARDGRLCGRVPGGPLLEAATLATLRERLAGYLGRADLEVRALSWRDLRYHPACAVVEGEGLWAPLFWEDGHLATPDLPVRVPGLAAALRALREVHDGAGPLVLTCPDPRARAELAAAARRCGYVLSVPDGRARTTVEVWQVDGVVGCAPPDTASSGTRMLMAADVWTLADLVGRELERAGRARAEEIRVHRAGEAAGA
ncbi:MAG: hypothetical protein QN155_07065 [Armatimonadota bacterium]|nr:hypothetical protein [Armatimonadota bacterium]MDR7403930.1 hypothetical protein [Armatimonadota bacterium]